VSSTNPELLAAQTRGIKTRSYPQALADITNSKRQIAVAGSHGKSSTTSLIGVMMQASSIGGSTIVGTQLPQFNGSNYYHDTRSEWFAIEACEYKRHFLEYAPEITVITNIDIDHLDYYRDSADYLSAFVSLVEQTKEAIVLSALDPGCRDLYAAVDQKDRDRLDWYWVGMNQFVVGNPPLIGSLSGDLKGDSTCTTIPHLRLQMPGEHLRLDGNLAYAVGQIMGISDNECVQGLESYTGSWRRSEVVGKTIHGNTVISDYGHHPSEIIPTLRALKERYVDKELVVVFQPHQHSRTRQLLQSFATAFTDADVLIIPDIYASRDTPEDIAWMTVERLVETIRPYKTAIYGGAGREAAIELIRGLDAEKPGKRVLVLLGAGSIDEYRESLVPHL
jgi:UDP-N-acetylmuramate--alanine ligase